MTDNIFDFNAELEKLITCDKDTIDDNECLISKEKLDDTRVKLECGHTFNYEPLYNEIVKQKSGFRACEIVKLQTNQIKCPYCRNIQDKLLPYASKLNLKRINGVNSPLKFQMLSDRCCYSNNNKKSKYFNNACNSPCWGKYCNTHAKFKSVIKSENKITVKESSNDEEIIQCKCIIKSGPRKGESCNGKLFLDNKCKRHYNLNKK